MARRQYVYPTRQNVSKPPYSIFRLPHPINIRQPENQNGAATARRQSVHKMGWVGWQDVGEPPMRHVDFRLTQ